MCCGGAALASALRPYQGPLADEAKASFWSVLRGPSGANLWGLCFFRHLVAYFHADDIVYNHVTVRPEYSRGL